MKHQHEVQTIKFTLDELRGCGLVHFTSKRFADDAGYGYLDDAGRLVTAQYICDCGYDEGAGVCDVDAADYDIRPLTAEELDA